MKKFRRLLHFVRSGIDDLEKHPHYGVLPFSLCVFRGFLFYYAYGLKKHNHNPFCVLIDRKVELDISPNARIVVANGASLMIGIWEPIALPGRCNVKIRMDGTGALIVNGRFLIGQGCRIHISNNAVVQMDSGGLVGDDRISCAERIQMGKNFVASWGVDILDSDGHPIFFDKNDPNPTAKSAPVIIGDDCWIGHDAIILKGVVINDGAIIGAGSVVTRDVPHHTIVAGNPIRDIRENAYWKV